MVTGGKKIKIKSLSSVQAKPPTTCAKSERQQRAVSSLKPWPRYEYFVRHVDAADIEALAASIQKCGLKQPIEIAPDGRILDGHTRWAAVKLLGWDEVPVLVRNDLADDEAALEQEFLTANSLRRKQTPLGAARCYRRDKELRTQGRASNGEGNLRDQFAKVCGISGRHLEAWEKMLDLADTIQLCLERGTLGLTHGQKIAGMSLNKREQIVAAIEGGQNPKAAVRQFASSTQRASGPGRALTGLAKAVKVFNRLTAEEMSQVDRATTKQLVANLAACLGKLQGQTQADA